MELDDLKIAWARMEQRLDESDRRWNATAQERMLDRSRGALRRFGWAQLPELIAWIALVVVAAPFWLEHRHVPHLLLAGLVLHAYGIAGIWSSVTRGMLAARVLHAHPVVQMQSRVAKLRRFTTVSTVALGLPWFCLWLVLTLVLMKRFLGVDLYLAAPAWFLMTLGFGVAGIAASVCLARRWSRMPPRAAWLRSAIDNLSGCNLRRAQAQLDEAAGFERG